MRKLKLEELNRKTINEYKKSEKLPVMVVLDDIRSAMNVGSIFRTSDAFALEGIYLCGITASPPHREITKTAIGATESVSWNYEKKISDALQRLKASGYRILGVEQTDVSVPLASLEINPEEKYAVAFGNEVNGLNEDILDLVDVFIEIPQYGTKHSLNVAVCAGIVLWELQSAFRNA